MRIPRVAVTPGAVVQGAIVQGAIVAAVVVLATGLAGCSTGSDGGQARGLGGSADPTVSILAVDPDTIPAPAMGTLLMAAAASGSQPRAYATAGSLSGAGLSGSASQAAADFFAQGGTNLILYPMADASAESIASAASAIADMGDGTFGLVAAPELRDLAAGDWAGPAAALAQAAQAANSLAVLDPPATAVSAAAEVDGGDPAPIVSLADAVKSGAGASAQWAVLMGSGVGPDADTAHAASGAYAGVVSEQVLELGVWNALGANQPLQGLVGEYLPSQATMGALNVASAIPLDDPADRGWTFWGARTVDSSTRLREVPARMLSNYLDDYIPMIMNAYVFSPNDEMTWNTMEASIGQLLADLASQGALQGNGGSNPYSVSCGQISDVLDGTIPCEVTASFAATDGVQYSRTFSIDSGA